MLWLGGNGVGTAPAPVPTPSATVQLQVEPTQVAVVTEADTLRDSGFDGQQVLLFAPQALPKAGVMRWVDVPVSVKDFVIEYLAKGKYSGPGTGGLRVRSSRKEPAPL